MTSIKQYLYFSPQGDQIPLYNSVALWDEDPKLKFDTLQRVITTAGIGGAEVLSSTNFSSDSLFESSYTQGIKQYGNLMKKANKGLRFGDLVDLQAVAAPIQAVVDKKDRIVYIPDAESKLFKAIKNLYEKGDSAKLLDVSAITEDGSKTKTVTRSGKTLKRGHPDLPLVSDNYDHYEMAIMLLPGGKKRYMNLLQEVYQRFQETGYQAYDAGVRFYSNPWNLDPIIRRIEQEGHDPGRLSDNPPTILQPLIYAKYDKRTVELRAIDKQLKLGLIDAATAERLREEVLARLPIKGTNLQEPHVFSKADYELMVADEPQIEDKASFGKLTDMWINFCRGNRNISDDFPVAYNKFMWMVLDALEITPTHEQYIYHPPLEDDYNLDPNRDLIDMGQELEE